MNSGRPAIYRAGVLRLVFLLWGSFGLSAFLGRLYHVGPWPLASLFGTCLVGTLALVARIVIESRSAGRA